MSSRVGSLYYEVILDPSGFSKGVTKVRNEQKMLEQSLKKSNMNDPNRQKELLRARLANIHKLRQEGKISASMAKKLRDEELADWKRHLAKKKEEHEAQVAEEIRRERDKNDRIIRDRRKLLEKERLRREKEAKEIASRRHGMQRSFQFGIGTGVKRNIKDVTDQVGAATTGLGKFAAGVTAIQGKIGSLMGFIFPLVLAFGALAAAVSKAVGVLLGFASAADRVKLQLSELTVILGGNREAAARLRKELFQYAKETAFSVSQTSDLAKQLIALGMTADEVVPQMRLLGNLAMGDPQKLKLIAKAYMDVRSQTKLMATEVRQFANQGVPILTALAELTGKSVADIKKMMKDGEIGAKEVGKALELISAKWGDTASARMGTIAGQSEQIAEQWEEISSWLGEAIQEDLVEIISLLNSILSISSHLKWQIKGMGGGLKEFMWEAIPFGKWIEGFMEKWVLLRKTIALFTGEQLESAEDIVKAAKAEVAEAERLAKLEEQANARRVKAEARREAFESKYRDMVDEQYLHQFKGFDLELERYKLQTKRLVQEGKITASQGRQLLDKKKELLLHEQRLHNAEIEEKRQEEFLKRKEERERELNKGYEEHLKLIESTERKKRSAFDSSNSAAKSFGAGSVAEYEMISQLALQSRRDAQQKRWAEDAAAQRDAALAELVQIKNNLVLGPPQNTDPDLRFDMSNLGGDPLLIPLQPLGSGITNPYTNP